MQKLQSLVYPQLYQAEEEKCVKPIRLAKDVKYPLELLMIPQVFLKKGDMLEKVLNINYVDHDFND